MSWAQLPMYISEVKNTDATLLETNSRVRPEQAWSQIRTGLTDNWKRVTGRTWLQLMCCTHLYVMWVCPIISEWLSETGVRWKLDRGQSEIMSEGRRSERSPEGTED